MHMFTFKDVCQFDARPTVMFSLQRMVSTLATVAHDTLHGTSPPIHDTHFGHLEQLLTNSRELLLNVMTRQVPEIGPPKQCQKCS